jgi:VanZ family protein
MGTELTLPGPQAELVDVIVDSARASASRILIS